MNTGAYTCVELFARAVKGREGVVRLISKTDERALPAGKKYYAWLKFPVEQDTEYRIEGEGCEISLCYLSGCEEILDKGIRYLEKDKETGEYEIASVEAWYDTDYREQYHFVPWKNWINDPNGLCYFKGRYHMFYQFNPHGQEWSNMYWGHTVSRDLVHWTHLPVVLQPQQEILDDPEEKKGGAFSGCAVTEGEEAIFYLTRHIGPLEDGEETIQKQYMMKSRDMLHFTQEKLVIGERPAKASFDFRDPKVLKIGDTWYMVLASAAEGKAVILLYESKDMESWSYAGPLLTEQEEGVRCFECPDFMELDGKYLAWGALMCHYDEGGRYQMTRYYIGDFQEKRLEVQTQGFLDFGSNCYAAQSFEHEGRRICINWVSDFYGEHRETENGAYGSMTLPRELHIKNNRLYALPVKEIESLRGDLLYQGKGENISLKRIPGNCYMGKLSFKENTEFTLVLGREGEKEISLVNDQQGLRIVTKGVKSENVLFRADVNQVTKLEIYKDRRLLEVYVNEGEAVGTKVFYQDSKEGCFFLTAKDAACIENGEIYKMEAIWKK